MENTKDYINAYINSLLDSQHYGSDVCCADIIKLDDIIDAICSSKYRKTKITEDTRIDILKKV